VAIYAKPIKHCFHIVPYTEKYGHESRINTFIKTFICRNATIVAIIKGESNHFDTLMCQFTLNSVVKSHQYCFHMVPNTK
jgi:hypothetical protein